MPVDDLFHPIVELPEPIRADRYRRLVGLEETKQHLRREALMLADPTRLQKWAIKHHGDSVAALKLFGDRAPLFVFAGDVGAGKSALAESFGCDIAEALNVPVFLYRLKLTARGSGLVGEMTTLIGEAFTHVITEGRKAKGPTGPRSVLVVVIDEADALTQSRASNQMHHEDRAGVDAVLAGVDSLAGEHLPVIVVMCTNREQALDPAVARRAARTFVFDRPTDEQRREVLQTALDGLDIDARTITKLVTITGPHDDQPGFTYSDLTQRLVPTCILAAFPDEPVTAALTLSVAATMKPTPVFTDGTSQ